MAQISAAWARLPRPAGRHITEGEPREHTRFREPSGALSKFSGQRYLHVDLHTDRGSTDTSSVAGAGNDPQNQLYLRSSMDLPHHIEFDLAARYIDGLITPRVPGYISLDARLGWQASDHLEVAIVGQNLLDAQHAEFGAKATRHDIERGVYATMTYRW